MHVAILGTGNMGAGLSRRIARTPHTDPIHFGYAAGHGTSIYPAWRGL